MDHKENIKYLNIAFVVFILMLLLLLALVSTKDAPEERVVLLSFDVEPVDGEQSVLDVLEVLERQNVTATFFVTGEYALEHPDVVRAMGNHEIACHSMTHPVMTKLEADAQLEEMMLCKHTLEAMTGQKIEGFRSPYHRIDSSTYDALESEGFIYDATIIRGLSFIFPPVGNRNIGEIPVSSILGIPLEDVIWTYYLRMTGPFFYLLRNKESSLESYVFHPHHTAPEAEKFEEFIKFLKNENVKFISHSGLINFNYERATTGINSR